MNTAYLYVHEGFADWEAAFAVAGLNEPRWQRQPGRWRVRTVAATTQSLLRSMGGVGVLADLGFEALAPGDGDLLILPGGPHWEEPGTHGEAIAAARRWADAGQPLAAICGATAGLARAGVLDDRAHTSNAAAYLKGTAYRGAEHYVDAPAVTDRGVITAGGMAPLEFAREIFSLVGLYDDAVLEAWYQLYKTGRPEHFARMQAAAGEDG
ncbi:glutamine amidotransferase [Rubrivivax gelatinosus]|nr:glutamine amidotransferase [Rubrivivax gelatinosus]